MPVQTQQSNLAAKLGGRISAANAEHKDKPIDTGNMQLPAGIRGGVAKLSSMYTKEYPDDKNGPGTKGQLFFRASAIALSPEFHDGQKVAGGVTSVVIPLCDMPAKGHRKASSFNDNWYEFQNLFKLLSNGAIVCQETAQTDPTGQKTWAFYVAAMQALTDPKREPIHVDFSTRRWTPPPTPAQPKPTEMVFENWNGLAQWNGKHNPAAGVNQAPTNLQPDAYTQAPTAATNPVGALNPTGEVQSAEPFNEFAGGTIDQADVVASLVEIAMNDPQGATEDGAKASMQLEEIAWGIGWTKEQTGAAADWVAVGDMALNPPPAPTPTLEQAAAQFPNSPTITAAAAAAHSGPTVGSKHKFAKRTKDGAKLTDNKGTAFPPQEVEVVTVDTATKTCTVKTVKDGKSVVDIRTKQPVAVKFEWLE